LATFRVERRTRRGRTSPVQGHRSCANLRRCPGPVPDAGLGDAIGLGRALDRMPGRLIVHAVEAGDLSEGAGLTPAVAAVIDALAAAVLQDLRG